MNPTTDFYPVFEANQVLMSEHLNEVFDYLDDQERLTRANLIGIGIVCGLEVSVDASRSTVTITRGCGVTSEGYLIEEPEDVSLTAYRRYTPPSDIAYRQLAGLRLWEMFPDGEPNTTPFRSARPATGVRPVAGARPISVTRPPGSAVIAATSFLDGKAVLLFLELKKDSLRNCSPNNCDDKGSGVAASVRRLLIDVGDLEKMIVNANHLGAGATAVDIEKALFPRLHLPDVRLPRYNVPDTSPVTSNDVLAAFFTVFGTNEFARSLNRALTSAYDAFKPVLQASYAANPFATLQQKFPFLPAPTSTADVKWLQYYYDFLDDLVRAYDEFRWKGADLMCACCPPAELFPRHLMLGLLTPSSKANALIYRQRFLASPAQCGCGEKVHDVQQLFRRLVEMIAHFTTDPLAAARPLPAPRPPLTALAGVAINMVSTPAFTDPQIRITPSALGAAALSRRAIPYYYGLTGTPPLYELWSPEKTRRGRAKHNLAYRANQYPAPVPEFVTNPLEYDLEATDFLRIEGHLGKDYRRVLNTLLQLKRRFRLPIDVVAVRTGAFDDRVVVDPSVEKGRFQDLESLYESLRQEILTTLTEGARFLYDLPVPNAAPGSGVPQLELLKDNAPRFRYSSRTIGAWYEQNIAKIQAIPYIDVNQDAVDGSAVLMVYCKLFANATDLDLKSRPQVVAVYYFSKLAEVLPPTIDALQFADFENKYEDLLALIRFFRDLDANDVPETLRENIPKEELIDHFDDILSSCRLGSMRAVQDEYRRRIHDLKQKQLLGAFLKDHPGIQHKAGVPIGGTFVVVYHGTPRRLVRVPGIRIDATTTASAMMARSTVTASPAPVRAVERVDLNDDDTGELAANVDSIIADPILRAQPNVRAIIGYLTGRLDFPPPSSDAVDKIISEAVGELEDGTVIADFFLPYLCCTDCSPIQFVLPAEPPRFSWDVECTDPKTRKALVTLQPSGGAGPYSVVLDGDPPVPLSGRLSLAVGTHSVQIRDASGAESAAQSLTVVAPLAIGQEFFREARGTYQVRFSIVGGHPPYRVNVAVGTIDEAHVFTSVPVKDGQSIEVEIEDSKQCKVAKTFTHRADR